ncbi:MAG: hypothetical protein H6686_09775 [Fibrobacteria bacterium]|nr:hypothetical protein [Fibrobacteria bacterium]
MLLSALLSCLLGAWHPLPPTGSSSLVGLHAWEDTLLACGNGGCAATWDQGATWVRRGEAIFSETETNFSGPNGIAISGNSVVRSLDHGRTWTRWQEGIPTDQNPSVIQLQRDFAVLSTIRSNRNDSSRDFPDSCLWYVRSFDQPQWSPAGSAEGYSCREFAIGYEGSLFRTRTNPRGELGTIVERSTNRGVSWDSLRDSATVRRIPGGLFVLDIGYDSTLVSSDSGRTWTKKYPRIMIGSFLDGAFNPQGDLRFIQSETGASRTFTFDSLVKVRSWVRIGETLWAYGEYGLFRSSDSGLTWIRSDANFPLGASRSLLGYRGGIVSLERKGGRQILSISQDDGSSWSEASGWLQNLYRVQACRDGLMGLEAHGTLVFGPEGSRTIAQGSNPVWISCHGNAVRGLKHDSLLDWNGSGWTSTPFRAPVGLLEIAASEEGLFFRRDEFENDRMVLEFLPDGSDSLVSVPLAEEPFLLTPSPFGVWVSTYRGLVRCTNARDCRRMQLPAMDTLGGSFLPVGMVSVQDSFVIVSTLPLSDKYTIDPSRSRLFVSADSGNSWTSLVPPTSYALQAVVTSKGIVANTYGQGFWLMESEQFRSSAVPTRMPSRPTLRARLQGRDLVVDGVSGPGRLRLLDASGRTLLSRQVTPQQGRIHLATPSLGAGIKFLHLQSGPRNQVIPLLPSFR